VLDFQPTRAETLPSKGIMAININTAATKELTQLPGIAKNLAYRIVAHRRRHGWFSQWEELAEVKEFPIHKLEEIKKRATLEMPEDGTPRAFRRLKRDHLEREAKKPKGYRKDIRSTRLKDRLKRSV
jgi:competence ComEA-like helix-hairpin-helix protein